MISYYFYLFMHSIVVFLLIFKLLIIFLDYCTVQLYCILFKIVYQIIVCNMTIVYIYKKKLIILFFYSLTTKSQLMTLLTLQKKILETPLSKTILQIWACSFFYFLFIIIIYEQKTLLGALNLKHKFSFIYIHGPWPPGQVCGPCGEVSRVGEIREKH